MSGKHVRDLEKEENISSDTCLVCRNFDPDLAPRITKKEDTIFSIEPFGFSLGVKEEPDNSLALYEIDKPLFEVATQARRGCKACEVLLHSFIFSWNTSAKIDPERNSMRAMTDAVQSLYLHAKFSPGKHVSVHIVVRNASQSEGTTFFSRNSVLFYQLFAPFNKLNPWDMIGQLEYSPRSVLNDGYRDFARNWIRRCAEEHPYCGALTPRKMPKRLVNVEHEDDTIYLEQDVTEPSPYIALSHCWQFSQPLKMTRDRLKRTGTSIRLEELSPTLRDAVRIARWLKVRYLWIDSLCIIQDDKKDWQEQSVQMGNIYRQSYFTIAAHVDVKSPSPVHGCFLERDNFYELPHEGHSGEKFHTLVRGDFTHSEDPATSVSLMGRGWCFQERLLASRIIHFRPGEISFECFSGTACECDILLPHDSRPWGRVPYDSIKGGLGEFATITESGGGYLPPDTNQDLDVKKAWTTWNDVVSKYAAADFTFKTDRLPALASVASRMPQRVFGSYIAGLWTQDLILQLLWSHTTHAGRRFRDKPYVAPSWSWASGSGPVDAWFRWRHPGPGNSYHIIVAKVRGKNRELATSEPYGQVRDASIRLYGRVAPVRLCIPPFKRMYWILKALLPSRVFESLSGISRVIETKLDRLGRMLNFGSRALRSVRDFAWRVSQYIFTMNATEHVADIAQLARTNKPFQNLDGWTGVATADTEEDEPRMALESLIAIELVAYKPDFSASLENSGRIQVGALLLAPSKTKKGAYDRVALIEFQRDIKGDESIRTEECQEENLRRLNDCFTGCEEREITIV